MIALALALITTGCGKDSGGGGGGTTATTPNNDDLKHVNTAICTNAHYQNGRWYDYNGVELSQCSGIQNYMNSKYLLSYDNNYCQTRLYQKRRTYHIILNGINKCAAEEYFTEFGNNQIYPQYGQTHYIGFAPPSYYNYYHGGYSWPGQYGYNNGFHCYGWGCDIGDGKWNFGDFVAIGLGAGLIFAIANSL